MSLHGDLVRRVKLGTQRLWKCPLEWLFGGGVRHCRVYGKEIWLAV